MFDDDDDDDDHEMKWAYSMALKHA